MMAQVAAFKQKGMSNRQIAHVLNFSKSAVNRAVIILKNRAVPPASESGLTPSP
jgi:transposase